MEYLNIFKSTPILNIVFFVFALLGIVTSVALFIKGKKNRVPCYFYRFFDLLNQKIDKPEEFHFSFKGEKIDKLTLLKISIWNDGKEAIRKDDVPEKDSIRIEGVDGVRFLKAELDNHVNPINNCSLTISDEQSSVTFNFDYLDYGEGLKADIYLTYEKKCAFYMKGTVIGSSGLKKINRIPLDERFVNYIIPDFLIVALQDKNFLIKSGSYVLFYTMLIIVSPISILLDFFEKLSKPLRKIPRNYLFGEE